MPSEALSEGWVPVYRKRVAALVLALAFVQGLVGYRDGGARIVSIFGFASALVLWCVLDSRMHGKLFLRSYGWLMMFTWPVGMLAYLVWTRGAGAVVLYVIYALMFLFCAGTGLAVGGVLRQ